MACCFALLAALPLSGFSYEQQAVSLDQFDSWEDWPLLGPGDLPIRQGELGPLRIEFDGKFPGPEGFGRGSLIPSTMYMDVAPTRFHDEAAVWVQWTSRPAPGVGGAPALDMLILERETFRLLFRIGASARGSWTGRYEVLNARPERLVQVSVDEEGGTETSVLDGPGALFDFASYPFLFGQIELSEGRSFRLAGYEYLEKEAEILPVYVVGETTVRDANDVVHAVWQVDVMPGHRATLISFYVSQEPPYFYGWDHRLASDGSMALQLTYRGWVLTGTA